MSVYRSAHDGGRPPLRRDEAGRRPGDSAGTAGVNRADAGRIPRG